MGRASDAPLAGLRVVEASLGISAVGAGMAASLPGALLRDLGADVARVQLARRSTLDAGLELERAWNRGKEIVEVGDDPARAAETVRALAGEADVLIVAGAEEAVERHGLGYADLGHGHPELVHVRVRPSWDAAGMLPDLELLLHARTGLLTQFRAHRPGPAFCALTVGSAGAALTATAGALSALYERGASGRGGWVETSLLDGLLAILPMIIGRVDHPTPSSDLQWNEKGPAESLAYRCADGEYLQLWFGAKGAYEAFLEHIGDPPTEAGYTADLVSGAIAERSARWEQRFATRDRSDWLDELAGHAFRCEPILRPGQALLDPHVREVGLSIDCDDGGGTVTLLGPVVRVTPVGPRGGRASRGGAASADGTSRLLSGVHVLDLSAYLAGPVTPQILAELGADVVKIEPATGDVHRGIEPLFAAGQRGKRAVALDLKAPDAAPVLGRLFCWADVVHHNARLGLAERLGYDEDTVRAANPHVVYSHATGFGSHGPRASLPANDYLMQALAGVEAAMGGDGPPTFLSWGAMDVAGGWVSACAVLAALGARTRTGQGQSVRSSLLGAAMTLTSGAFVADGSVVEGPIADREQTGYGAAYRIYRGRDGAWFALAVPDTAAWERLRGIVPAAGLPASPPPLRIRRGERQPEEELLEAAFAARDAGEWVAELRAAGVPVEPVAEDDRAGFIGRLLDDPVGQQLGRVVAFDWGPRGRLTQAGFPLRLGPVPRPAAPLSIPALGEHTDEVLDAVGSLMP